MQKFLFSLVFLLLVGCGSQAESPRPALGVGNPAVEAGARSADMEPVPRKLKEDYPSILNKFKKGMVYGDLRSIALSNGWVPKVHPNCKQGVIGAAFEKICSSNPKRCEPCELAPELSECSGDGYCLMEFTSGSRVLSVATYGEIEDVLVTGKESRLQVTSWEVKPGN